MVQTTCGRAARRIAALTYQLVLGIVAERRREVAVPGGILPPPDGCLVRRDPAPLQGPSLVLRLPAQRPVPDDLNPRLRPHRRVGRRGFAAGTIQRRHTSAVKRLAIVEIPRPRQCRRGKPPFVCHGDSHLNSFAFQPKRQVPRPAIRTPIGSYDQVGSSHEHCS